MNSEGCWSTVMSSNADRRALGLPASAGWMLQCQLGVGHRGNHATDGGAYPRTDRRFWLEWNDLDSRAQSLIERNPCPVRSAENVGCRYFHGHPGTHAFAWSNGHVPTAMSPTAASGRYEGTPSVQPRLVAPESPVASVRTGTSTGDLPVMAAGASGAHRLPDHRVAGGNAQQTSMQHEPAPSESGSYRGGRRSTGADPRDDLPPYLGRRHSFDDPSADAAMPQVPAARAPGRHESGRDAESSVPSSAAVPPTPVVPAPTVPAPTVPAPDMPDAVGSDAGVPGVGAGVPDAVSDALIGVANALSHLADALRRR